MEPRLWTQKATGTPASDADSQCSPSVLYWGDLVYTLMSQQSKLLKEILQGSSTVATDKQACYQTVQQPFFLLPKTDTEPPSISEKVFNYFFWPSLSLVIGMQGTSGGQCPTHPRTGTWQATVSSSMPLFSQILFSPCFNWPCTYKCFRETQGSTAGALYYQFINAGIKNSFFILSNASKNRFL